MWKRFFLDDQLTDYEISEEGEVRKASSQKILKQSTQQGYKFVNIHCEGQQKRMRVHRLVALTFIPNPKNKPYVNHIDGVRDNNKRENLEWCTPSENTQHAVKQGLISPGKTKAVNQYNLEGDLMMSFESLKEAELQTETNHSKISECCMRKRLTANDYQWRYADDRQDVQKIKKNFNTGKRVAQCDENFNILNIYPSYRQAAIAVNGTPSAISRVCSGLNLRHKGYRWKIVEEIVRDID